MYFELFIVFQIQIFVLYLGCLTNEMKLTESSVPVSTCLKNYSAILLMIVHLELATSITRGNREKDFPIQLLRPGMKSQ